jgi:hypothetical protein
MHPENRVGIMMTGLEYALEIGGWKMHNGSWLGFQILTQNLGLFQSLQGKSSKSLACREMRTLSLGGIVNNPANKWEQPQSASVNIFQYLDLVGPVSVRWNKPFA